MLEKMLLSDSSSTPHYSDFIKKVTIKGCIYLIAETWDKTPQSTLSKAWNKVYSDRPFPYGSSEHNDDRPPVELLIPEELNAVVVEWETSDIGYEQLSDEDIIQHVRGSESPEEKEEGEDDYEEQLISHLDASQASQVFIDWLHQQSKGEPNQILQLRRLQRIAHLK